MSYNTTTRKKIIVKTTKFSGVGLASSPPSPPLPLLTVVKATFFLSILVFDLSVWQIEAYITVTLGGGGSIPMTAKKVFFTYSYCMMYLAPPLPGLISRQRETIQTRPMNQ
jgi:hypothetical protein